LRVTLGIAALAGHVGYSSRKQRFDVVETLKNGDESAANNVHTTNNNFESRRQNQSNATPQTIFSTTVDGLEMNGMN
jgi:hypothetical protein